MNHSDGGVPDSEHVNRERSLERLLFVADAAVADVGELPAGVRAVIDAAAEVYVVTPTLPGRLAWLADDVDRFRHVADERLDTVLDQMRSIGVHPRGLAAPRQRLAGDRGRRRGVPAEPHPDCPARPRAR
jgi:hypothetical protein